MLLWRRSSDAGSSIVIKMLGEDTPLFLLLGFLPAAIAGLDIDAIRAGAATVLLDMPEGGTKGYAPAEGAAVSVGLDLTKM